MHRKHEDSRPVWGTIGLIIFGIIDLAMGIILIFDPIKNSVNMDGLDTLVRFFVFCQVMGYIITGILLMVILLPKLYDPSGREIDRTHQWVYARSRKKFRDASMRDVYEHRHGVGTWEDKVKGDRKFLMALYMIIAVGLIIFGLRAVYFSERYPIIDQARAIIQPAFLFWVSLIAGAGAGGLSIVMLKYTFWDLKLGFESMDIPMKGQVKSSKYDFPPLILLIPRLILALFVLIMSIYGTILFIVPKLSEAKFGNAYSVLLPYLFLCAGALWLLGIFLSKPIYTENYKRQVQRKQDLDTTKDAIQHAFNELFKADTDKQTQIACAYYLIQERDKLTSEGIDLLLKALKGLTHADHGHDFETWSEELERLFNRI